MQKIVITGAAGLAGQNLIARLKSVPGLKIVGIHGRLPIQASIFGLQFADTCNYYLKDRGIAEDVRFSRITAETLKT